MKVFPIITQVDVPGRRLILSESATLLADLAAQLQEGDTVEGVVTSLQDYGAFVSMRSSDGELHGTQVLHVHGWPAMAFCIQRMFPHYCTG